MIVELDEKGRVLIPKEFRKIIRVESGQPLNLLLQDHDAILLEKIERKVGRFEKDPLLKDILKKPAHVSPKKLKELDLEKLEEELWSK